MTEQLFKRTAEIDRRVGGAVRAARIDAGLSQSRLAAELGITFQQLQKYEKGRNRIAIGTLLLIADALSVSVHRFLEGFGVAAAASSAASDPQAVENARLVAAFARVGDPEVRRRILTLVLAVTDGRDRPDMLIEAAAAVPALMPAT